MRSRRFEELVRAGTTYGMQTAVVYAAQMAVLSVALEMVRNFGLAVAAFVGIFLAWKRVTAATRQADATLQQAELARRGHVAELFNHAVGQLTDAKLEVRLGAIYTLRQIARDFPDLAEPTLELLSTYLRESAGKYESDEPPIDVREIMKTLRDHLVQK